MLKGWIPPFFTCRSADIPLLQSFPSTHIRLLPKTEKEVGGKGSASLRLLFKFDFAPAPWAYFFWPLPSDRPLPWKNVPHLELLRTYRYFLFPRLDLEDFWRDPLERAVSRFPLGVFLSSLCRSRPPSLFSPSAGGTWDKTPPSAPPSF